MPLLALQTAVAKSRAFVRLALNCGGGCLEEVLGALLHGPSRLAFFFHDSALLRTDKDAAVLVSHSPRREVM
jgi:hypothetical protein